MIILYVTRLDGTNADVSYNIAWMGLWVFAEISFGITVTGTFLLPKFIEAKGTKLHGYFLGLTRSFGNLLPSKKGSSAVEEVTLDTVTIMGHSENDFTYPDRDMERYPSSEGVHEPASYTGVKAMDTRARF